MGKVSLRVKLAGLLIAAMAIPCFAFFAWTMAWHDGHAITELTEQGRALARQMDSVWKFMSLNQDKLQEIAYDENGAYRGIHCAIAGTTIGRIFSEENDYSIRFVNHDPRNKRNVPDGFEAEALAAFAGTENVEEYYGVSSVDGQRVFRYVAPMTIQESCLTCHGQPAGELDMTGNAKEGWNVGDVGGAMSITMPVELYDQARWVDTVRNALFFVLLVVVSVGIVFLGLSYLVVRPLKKIERGVESMSADYQDVELGGIQSSSETGHIVSRLNHTAAELTELRRDLERKVDERTRSLNEANALLERSRDELAAVNEQLRSQNAYKSQFLSMMSHELRTPLTSITASAALLSKRLDNENDTGKALDVAKGCLGKDDGGSQGAGATVVGVSPGMQREGERARDRAILREIEGSSHTLLILISDILEMGRLEAGRASFEPELLDVGDVVQDVRGTIAPLAREKNLAFCCSVAPDVPLLMADFEKLRRTLENLLSNAVKFTDQGGSVSLRVGVVGCTEKATGGEGAGSADAEGNGPGEVRDGCFRAVRFAVSDTGCGIPAESLSAIFDSFTQADGSAARQYNGSGLGLALVRQYVDMHGGSVSVESDEGTGSTFIVDIPVGDEAKEGLL